MSNPYEAPHAALVDDATALTPRNYGGIQRIPFVGMLVALIVLSAFVVFLFLRNPPFNFFTMSALMLLYLGFIATILLRLQNIGMRWEWIVLLFFPVVNFFVIFRCLVCQEGYSDVGKLDHAGRMTKYALVTLFLLSFLTTPFLFS